MEGTTGENAQVAAGPGENVQPAPGLGDNVQPAPAPSDNLSPAHETKDGQEPQEKGPVPYSRLEEQTRAKQAAVAEAEQLRQQNQQMQWLLQQAQLQSNRSAPPAGPDEVTQFITAEGIGKDGFLTAEELPKLVRFFEQRYEKQLAAMQRQQWFAAHPDYVGTVLTPTGQLTDTMLRILQEDRELAAFLQTNPNPAVAYALAKRVLSQTTEAVPKPTPTPAALVANLQPSATVAPRPATASIATAQGGGQLDKESQLRAMSKEEFAAYLAAVKARA